MTYPLLAWRVVGCGSLYHPRLPLAPFPPCTLCSEQMASMREDLALHRSPSPQRAGNVSAMGSVGSGAPLLSPLGLGRPPSSVSMGMLSPVSDTDRRRPVRPTFFLYTDAATRRARGPTEKGRALLGLQRAASFKARKSLVAGTASVFRGGSADDLLSFSPP
jgi:hypothetical protein